MPTHPVRMTLDVIMEDFWTRPSGVYRKPIFLRRGVLQLFYDDDNDPLKQFRGPAVPGGNVAFTGTTSVYSDTPITADDITIESKSPVTNALRKGCAAYVQRVRSCYLVEANLLGFAGTGSGLEVEHCVLSSALKWALSDFATRFGAAPEQIVLHLDVNGTLALGDLAGSKTFGKVATSLAGHLIDSIDADRVTNITPEEKLKLSQTKSLEESALRQQYTANYSRQDFIRSLVLALSALAPAAVRELDDELAGDFAANFRTKSTAQAFAEAMAQVDSPALTLAIRTNGTEHRQAAVYVQRLVHAVLGVELSEERGTIRRYIAVHEDRAKGLFFHPALLEKLHKSGGELSYGFKEYADEVNALYGRNVTNAAAWEEVSAGTLKKSDAKFKVYLGLCASADEKPASSSSNPPKLEVAFRRESWLMPGGKHNDYRCKEHVLDAPGPWWASFDQPAQPGDRPPATKAGPHQPYNVPISTEPVPGAPLYMYVRMVMPPDSQSAPASPSAAPLRLNLSAMCDRTAPAPTRLPNSSKANLSAHSATSAFGFRHDPDSLTPRSFRNVVKAHAAPDGGEYVDPDSVQYTYEEVVTGRGERVNPFAKEMYLSDDEFLRVFGYSKDQFYSLRAWRRRELKRQARLY